MQRAWSCEKGATLESSFPPLPAHGVLRYGSLGTPPLVSKTVPLFLLVPRYLVSSMFVSHCPRHLVVSSQDLPHPHYFVPQSVSQSTFTEDLEHSYV